MISNARQRLAFMNGQYSETGWWQFFPFCFAVKTPLGVLVLLLLALAAVAGGQRRCSLYDLWPMGVLVGIYSAVAVSSNINIGHRHILPVYPALFVFAGGAARWFTHRRMVVRTVPVAVLAVFMAESLAIWPHYLAFFNGAAGGPKQGYRRLVDSSLDWGQDLPGLKRWLLIRHRDHARHPPVYLAYFGTASPVHHRLAARIIPIRFMPWTRQIRRFASTFGPGTYCISATELQQVYGFSGGWRPDYENAYGMARQLASELGAAGGDAQALDRVTIAWGGREKIDHILGQLRPLQFARLCAALRQRQPDAHVGYSILIYHVSARELDRALNGPPESWKGALSREDS